MTSSNLDWLYHLLGYTLAAAGVLLLLWALFWDRSRGRRRCPKCWYDMIGVPGLKCSECGRKARGERMLFRTCVHRKALFLALLLLLGGLSLSGYRVPRATWLRQIPSWALVRIVPESDLKESAGAGWTGPSNAPRTLLLELERRVAFRRLSAAEWRVVIQRAGIVTPSREPWPLDQPLHVDFDIPIWMRSYVRFWTSADRAQRFVTAHRASMGIPAFNSFEPCLGGGLEPMDLYVAFAQRPPSSSVNVNPAAVPDLSRVLAVTGFRLECATTPSTAGLIQPAERLESDPVQVILADRLRVHGLSGPATTRRIVVGFDLRGFPMQSIAVAPRIEVLHNQNVVAQACLYLVPNSSPNRIVASAELAGDIARIPALDHLDSSWIVRISGDPLNSLRCQKCTKFWAGAFEVPLSQVRRDPFRPRSGSS